MLEFDSIPKMKFSIIIVTYNNQNTIKPCLEGVFSSSGKDFEVIVVDDKSTDRTKEIIQGYPCRLITLEKNKGAALARNIGKENSKGQILVFIDSDVVIKNDSLDVIDKNFSENKDIVAVTGILSKDCPYKDFFSQYKNLYMHFIFKRCPKDADFLYGSIMAIKKEQFLPFDETFRSVEDTELGQRYKSLNKKILLDRRLEVIHLKKYGLLTIMRNDFCVPFEWTKFFMMHKGCKDIFKKRRFAHARLTQLLAIFASLAFIVTLIFSINPILRNLSVTFLAIFLLLNSAFFSFLFRQKGFLFTVKSIVFTFFDSIIILSGILFGFIYFMKRKLARE